MTDLALIWDTAAGVADLGVIDGGLATDDGLRTAVIVSLFTDRRARPDDVLPGAADDRRGWWADAASPVAGDQIGSRLWLLAREKRTPATLTRARDYTDEALGWLIDDGVARSVEIEVQAEGSGSELVLAIGVVITRATGDRSRFALTWSAT